METTRGGWFLAEYAQRNRSADTNILLDAIGKLEGMMRRERKIPKFERIQLDLADMQEAIQRTRREIAQIKTESTDGDRFAEASSELDAIVTQTEGATQDILHKAELVQELTWTLREQGLDEKVCDDIDAHTTDIFRACSFQDLTGQHTQKVVQVLRYLESLINEMMEIWDVQADDMKVEVGPINPEEHRPDAHLLHGPQNANKAIQQNTVDALMVRPPISWTTTT
ncbi:protein phosphatase CheZ [Breoghania sp.]|uniref:protein phosphatase CheZ n=1 Tax=Breoghania sp. TaxID=2065378 RepID=UPI00262E6624|nr:protein phosphatase CheZ [Breoghania sp.]MDJ0931227.1 protein phosphatase CheZ [Breoghania sp.]